MAVRTAWTGAVNFGGFPLHLAAYPVAQSKSADSFKSLCPCHSQPIVQVKTCATTGDTIANDALLKGAEMSKGNIYALDTAAVEAIKAGESTKELDIERFPSLDTIPLWLADKKLRITANPKVPGSEQAANILWNGLRAGERAAVIDGWVMKAGSRPATLVIYADDDGLVGVTMPYSTSLNELPKGAFTEDEKAAAMFEAFVEAQDYSTDDFDIGVYVDMYRERRDEVIAKAIKGEPIEVASTEKPASAAPDLMAAMQAAMSATPKPAGKKKPAAKKKAKA
jgi:non-homologous end joining protein Ku